MHRKPLKRTYVLSICGRGQAHGYTGVVPLNCAVNHEITHVKLELQSFDDAGSHAGCFWYKALLNPLKVHPAPYLGPQTLVDFEASPKVDIIKCDSRRIELTPSI